MQFSKAEKENNLTFANNQLITYMYILFFNVNKFTDEDAET